MTDRTTRTRTRRRRATLLALALVTTLAATACGDDDDGDAAAAPSSTRPAASAAPPATAVAGEGDAAAYCAAVLAVETYPDPFAGPAGLDPSAMSPEDVAAAMGEYAAAYQPLLDAARDAAPGEIADDARLVVESFATAIDTGDFAVFDGEDVQAALGRIHEYDLANCGWNVVEVTATEYSFGGLPATLEPGPTSVEFVNEGNEVHHMVLARIHDDVDLGVEDILALPEEEGVALVDLIPSEPFATPGGRDYVVVDLQPGRYLAACFVPVGTVGMDGPPPQNEPHLAHGMNAEFRVG
jgi:hypothetical protein